MLLKIRLSYTLLAFNTAKNEKTRQIDESFC